MKFQSKFIQVFLLSFCIQAIGQNEAPNLDQFIGDWQGEGHFYNVDLDSEAGLLRFTLRVTSEMEITGSVGQAEFVDAEIEVDDWNHGYRIQGTLLGHIFLNSEFNKKRLILLLNDVQDDVTIGDFHLTNNFIFDFSMRLGEITLRRNP